MKSAPIPFTVIGNSHPHNFITETNSSRPSKDAVSEAWLRQVKQDAPEAEPVALGSLQASPARTAVGKLQHCR